MGLGANMHLVEKRATYEEGPSLYCSIFLCSLGWEVSVETPSLIFDGDRNPAASVCRVWGLATFEHRR